MWTRCPRHGANPPHRWTSVDIRDSKPMRVALKARVQWVPIFYPDERKVDVALLNESDLEKLCCHVEARGSIHSDYLPIRDTLPEVVQPRLLTIFHDRAARRLNDKIFIFKATEEIGAVCAGCLREAMRELSLPCDRDLGVPLLVEGRLLPWSPHVLRALGVKDR